MNFSIILQGSNIGDKVSTIEKSTELIQREIGEIEKTSSFYESEPWGFESNEWFINRVIGIYTLLSPINLLDKLLSIETSLGRVRNTKIKAYSSRTIDLDILFYNNEVIVNEQLYIPHPRLQFRKFTLLPLVEMYPDFVHPILNKTIFKLLEECNDVSKVIPCKSSPD